MFIFIVAPSRQDLAQPADDSASVRPQSSDAWHADNAEDLRRDDLFISRVHQLIRPVELIAADSETELVVETICWKHVPVRVKLPEVRFS